MLRYEDNCVGCPTEMGCLGKSCPYMNVPVRYCDICGDYAKYNLDNETDICAECARKMLQKIFDETSLPHKEQLFEITPKELYQELFNDLTLHERAKLLDIDLSEEWNE